MKSMLSILMLVGLTFAANVYTDSGSAKIHLTLRNNTRANLITNGRAATIGWATDVKRLLVIGSDTLPYDIQKWDADLDSVAALGGLGFSVRTAANTWKQRSIRTTGAGITISDSAGTAGNPVISLQLGSDSTKVAYGAHGHYSLTASDGVPALALQSDTGGNFTGSGYMLTKGIFGEIHCHDSTTAQSIPNGTTYTKATAFLHSERYQYVTPDTTNRRIIVQIAGYYECSFNISISSATNSVTYKMAVFLNTTEIDRIHTMNKIGTAGDVQTMGASGLLLAAVGDSVTLRVRHGEAGAVAMTPYYGNLNIHYLGN